MALTNFRRKQRHPDITDIAAALAGYVLGTNLDWTSVARVDMKKNPTRYAGQATYGPAKGCASPSSASQRHLTHDGAEMRHELSDTCGVGLARGAGCPPESLPRFAESD